MGGDGGGGIRAEGHEEVLALSFDLALGQRQDGQYVHPAGERLGRAGDRVVTSRPGKDGGTSLRTLTIQPRLYRIENIWNLLILVDTEWRWAADRGPSVCLYRVAGGRVVQVDHVDVVGRGKGVQQGGLAH